LSSSHDSRENAHRALDEIEPFSRKEETMMTNDDVNRGRGDDENPRMALDGAMRMRERINAVTEASLRVLAQIDGSDERPLLIMHEVAGLSAALTSIKAVARQLGVPLPLIGEAERAGRDLAAQVCVQFVPPPPEGDPGVAVMFENKGATAPDLRDPAFIAAYTADAAPGRCSCIDCRTLRALQAVGHADRFSRPISDAAEPLGAPTHDYDRN
jgi:hypothetical protein